MTIAYSKVFFWFPLSRTIISKSNPRDRIRRVEVGEGKTMSRTSFYKPPDQSQVEIIPTDMDSIHPCETDVCSRPSWSSVMQRESYDEGLDDSSSIYGRGVGYSTHLEEMSLRNKSTQFSESDIYTLSRMSTTTSRSSLSQRIRYRIVLKLDMRERNLIRDSWAMILSDDSTNNIAAYSRSKHKGLARSGVNTHSPQNSKRFSAHSSEASSTSDQSLETKSGVRSNAFTSSLFCSQFYANLLSMEPMLEQMFPSTKHQAVAFAGVLTAAINSLENLQLLENFLNGLGKRHSRILGIDPPHFELMGIAFLRTLQDRFGVHCTIELEDAWSKLYSYLANSILQFGLDPILHAGLDDDQLELPIPNLVESTPKTVINLKHDSGADRPSLVGESMLNLGDELETASIDSHFADIQSQRPSGPIHSSVKNSYGASSVSLPHSAIIGDPSPRKKSSLPPSRKTFPRKSETRKPFSKPVVTASNKDCIIM